MRRNELVKLFLRSIAVSVIRLLAILLIFVLLGCSTYYTKRYLIEEPPDDLFGPEKIITDLQGWDFFLDVSGPYRDPNRVRVQRDSFYVNIGAIAKNKMLIKADSVFIVSPVVRLLNIGKLYELESNSTYSTDKGIGFTYYPICIPSSEKYIFIKFNIVIKKSNGDQIEKEWQSKLYRYETKEKGIPAGLFDPPS